MSTINRTFDVKNGLSVANTIVIDTNRTANVANLEISGYGEVVNSAGWWVGQGSLQGLQGVQGSTGPQGLQGLQGLLGVQGAEGLQGLQGTQGTQGTQGLQGLQGTQGTQGVQGLQGLQGTQGTQGAQGLQGLQGTQGAQGLQGLLGIQGATGLQGLLGVQGLQGTQGTQGTQGLQGTQGTQGVQGLQGLQGTQGAQGLQGLQGTQGTQGLQGLLGVQGLQGLQGTQGAQGLQGTQGLQGLQGTQGLQGLTGLQGAQGLQGTLGVQGLQGTLGVQGFTGQQGLQGIQGLTGPVGGTTGQVLYNDGTEAAGDSTFTFDDVNKKLTVFDLLVSGNLNVEGDYTTLNVSNLAVQDSELILNAGQASPGLDAFVYVDRGSGFDPYIKWDEATDTWQWSDDGSSATKFSDLVLVAGDTMTGKLTINVNGEGLQVADANVTSNLIVKAMEVTTNTVTTTSTSQVVLDSWLTADYTSAKYHVQMVEGSNAQVTEVHVMHIGGNVYLTEYGSIQSGPVVGTITAAINNDSLELRLTPGSVNSTKTRCSRFALIT